MKNIGVQEQILTFSSTFLNHLGGADVSVPMIDGEPVEILSVQGRDATVRYYTGANEGLELSVPLSRLGMSEKDNGAFASVFESGSYMDAESELPSKGANSFPTYQAWRNALSDAGLRPGQFNNAAVLVVALMGVAMAIAGLRIMVEVVSPVVRTIVGIASRLWRWVSKIGDRSDPHQAKTNAIFEKILSQRWTSAKIAKVRRRMGKKQWASFANEVENKLGTYLDILTSSMTETELKAKLAELGRGRENTLAFRKSLDEQISYVLEQVDEIAKQLNTSDIDGLINATVGLLPALGIYLTATATTFAASLGGSFLAVGAMVAYAWRVANDKVPPLKDLFKYPTPKSLRLEGII